MIHTLRHALYKMPQYGCHATIFHERHPHCMSRQALGVTTGCNLCKVRGWAAQVPRKSQRERKETTKQQGGRIQKPCMRVHPTSTPSKGLARFQIPSIDNSSAPTGSMPSPVSPRWPTTFNRSRRPPCRILSDIRVELPNKGQIAIMDRCSTLVTSLGDRNKALFPYRFPFRYCVDSHTVSPDDIIV